MKNEDLQKLKAAALGAVLHSDTIGEDEWYSGNDNMAIYAPSPDLAFIAAASPVAILGLLAERDQLIAERQAAGAMSLSDEQIMAMAKLELHHWKSAWSGDDEEILVFAHAILAAAQPLQEPPSQQPDIAKLIHYPECWDVVAYPTVDDAMREIVAFKCADCQRPAPSQQPKVRNFQMARLARLNKRVQVSGENLGLGDLFTMKADELADLTNQAIALYAAAQAPQIGLQPEMLAFLKEFVENSYEQDVGGGDLVVTTCEAREKAVALLKSIEGPSKHKRWCNGDPANCVNNEGHGCPCEASAAPLNKAGSEVDHE